MEPGKKTMVRMTQIFLCLLMVSLGACTGNTQENEQLPFAQQVYRTSGGVETLDPAQAQDIGSLQVIDMIFTGLVSVDDNFNIHAQLASTWTVSGLTWTFTLKPNLKFSDGTPLTSNDVAYSINRALQPATASPDCMTFLGVIKDAKRLPMKTEDGPSIIGDSIHTPDSHTLQIVTTTTNAQYFLRALSEACSFTVEKKLIKKYGAHFTEHLNEGGGDGPFVVSDYNPTHGIDFVRNPNYSGPKPLLREVSFVFYQDQLNNYQGYQLIPPLIDETPIPDEEYGTFSSSSSDFHQVSLPASYFFMMNYRVKPFDNIHIRQAFALALNRYTIADAVSNFGEAIPTYNLIPQSLGNYYSSLKLTGPARVTDLAGTPTLAHGLLMEGLHEEGWESVSQMPPITLTYLESPHVKTINDLVITPASKMWQQVLGIKVTLDPISDATIFSDMINKAKDNPNGLQFWAQIWQALYPDPRFFTTQVFGNGEQNNTVNYGQNSSTDVGEQVSVQKKLENADSLNDDDRYQVYQQVEQQLVNDVAWMPVFQLNNTFLLKPYVRSLVKPYVNSLGSRGNLDCTTKLPVAVYIILMPSYAVPPDDWACIYIAPH